MKAYIYSIINVVNNKRYVGQSWNYEQRQKNHLKELKGNYHRNPKLQAAWNKYGSENFKFEVNEYEIKNQKELDLLEIDTIKKYDSFYNGYNLTLGGQGGYQISPNKRKLDFVQFCIAYVGNKKYGGMTNKTAQWFGCDSSTISSILNKNAYPDYQLQYTQLSEEERTNYLQIFENHFVNELKTTKGLIKVDEDLTFEILCVVSSYSRGIEQAILKKFNMSKGFVINCFRYGNSHKKAKDKLKSMSPEEIQSIGKLKFIEWELNKYNAYLKPIYTDLFVKYSKYL